jgi:hypothetical protein
VLPELVVGCLAVLLLAGCERNASAPAAGGSVPNAAAAASPVAASPAAVVAAATAPEDEGDDDITLVADADPDSGAVPLRVHFSVAPMLDEELNQPTYTWDFGDGSPPSHERNPEHTYVKPGDYLATVRLVNKTGERGWDEVDIEAENSALPAGEE